jgi:hypothetical protein
MGNHKQAYLPCRDLYRPVETFFNVKTAFLAWMRYSQRTLTKLDEVYAYDKEDAQFTEYSELSEDQPNKNKIRASIIDFTEGIFLEELHPPSRDEKSKIVTANPRRRHSIVVNTLKPEEKSDQADNHPFLVSSD